VEQKVDKNDARLRAIHSLVDTINKSLDDFNVHQGGATNKMKADLTMLLKQLETQLERMMSELDESQFRLRELEKKVDILSGSRVVPSQYMADSLISPGGDSIPNQPAGNTKIIPGLDIEKLYLQAREDYIIGKYKLAFKGFKTVYEKDVGGSYKDNALYWMGECRYKQNQLAEAVGYYARCIEEFPQGNKICSAFFKLGMVFGKQGNTTGRNETWNKLMEKCPGSNEAHRANELIKK
jgi:TolA-binding protein